MSINDSHALAEIKRMITDLSGQVTQIKKRSDEVYYAVAGNELDKSQGISERLRRAEKEIKELRDAINRAKWTATGLGIGMGAAGGGLVSLVMKLIAG